MWTITSWFKSSLIRKTADRKCPGLWMSAESVWLTVSLCISGCLVVDACYQWWFLRGQRRGFVLPRSDVTDPSAESLLHFVQLWKWILCSAASAQSSEWIHTRRQMKYFEYSFSNMLVKSLALLQELSHSERIHPDPDLKFKRHKFLIPVFDSVQSPLQSLCWKMTDNSSISALICTLSAGTEQASHLHFVQIRYWRLLYFSYSSYVHTQVVSSMTAFVCLGVRLDYFWSDRTESVCLIQEHSNNDGKVPNMEHLRHFRT